MRAIQFGTKAIGYVIHFFIPAGGRFVENVIDPDVGDSYGSLIAMSFALSVATIVVSAMMFFVPTPLGTPEELQVWFWFRWLMPGIIWICSWGFYFEAKNFF